MELAVAPAQLIHQILQMGRQRGFRAHALLQPFADALADGSGCLVIDSFGLVVDLAVHDEFLRRVYE
jgi:hypothetical protein